MPRQSLKIYCHAYSISVFTPVFSGWMGDFDITEYDILEQIWDMDGQFVGEGTVSVTVNRLRRKIDTRPGQESYITNVFGFGYRFGE